MAPHAHSRRAFLGMCGATAAAAALPGCGEGGPAPPPAHEVDAGLLNVALRLEHVAVAVYADGRDLLRGRARRTATDFLEQEREHVRWLTRTIKGLGGPPAEARSLTEYRRSFPSLREGRDVLRFAVDLENRVVRSYMDGLGRISDDRLRRIAGQVVTTEAEQITVLLGELGRDPLPTPFVTGTTT